MIRFFKHVTATGGQASHWWYTFPLDFCNWATSVSFLLLNKSMLFFFFVMPFSFFLYAAHSSIPPILFQEYLSWHFEKFWPVPQLSKDHIMGMAEVETIPKTQKTGYTLPTTGVLELLKMYLSIWLFRHCLNFALATSTKTQLIHRFVRSMKWTLMLYSKQLVHASTWLFVGMKTYLAKANSSVEATSLNQGTL